MKQRNLLLTILFLLAFAIALTACSSSDQPNTTTENMTTVPSTTPVTTTPPQTTTVPPATAVTTTPTQTTTASPATTTTTTPPQTTTVSSVLEIRYETYMPSTKTTSATDERNADPLQEEPVLSDAMRFQNHIYGYRIYFPESWDGRINFGIDEYGNLTVNHRGMGEYSRGHLFDIVALELKYAPELREFSSGQRFVENNGIYLTHYMYFDSNQEYAICARFSNDPQYFLDGELNEETIIEKTLNEEYFAMRNDLSEGRVVVVALPIYQSY